MQFILVNVNFGLQTSSFLILSSSGNFLFFISILIFEINFPLVYFIKSLTIIKNYIYWIFKCVLDFRILKIHLIKCVYCVQRNPLAHRLSLKDSAERHGSTIFDFRSFQISVVQFFLILILIPNSLLPSYTEHHNRNESNKKHPQCRFPSFFEKLINSNANTKYSDAKPCDFKSPQHVFRYLKRSFPLY